MDLGRHEVTYHGLQETWDRFSRYTDKDFDYIDASSFVFMDRHEMDTAFTFDRHYLQMNYKVVPQRRR